MKTVDGDTFKEQFTYDGAFKRSDQAMILAETLVRKNNFKVELNGEKVRVYGSVDKKGKLHLPTVGSVASKDLKLDQLPKVKNPS